MYTLKENNNINAEQIMHEITISKLVERDYGKNIKHCGICGDISSQTDLYYLPTHKKCMCVECINIQIEKYGDKSRFDNKYIIKDNKIQY